MEIIQRRITSLDPVRWKWTFIHNLWFYGKSALEYLVKINQNQFSNVVVCSKNIKQRSGKLQTNECFSNLAFQKLIQTIPKILSTFLLGSKLSLRQKKNIRCLFVLQKACERPRTKTACDTYFWWKNRRTFNLHTIGSSQSKTKTRCN